MRLFFLIVFVSVLASCQKSKKFNAKIWSGESEPDYCEREKMLNDLTENHKLKGIAYKDLKGMLGDPNFTDSLSATYDIYIDYDVIDPRSGERLVFYLNKDSTINYFKVEKWSNRRQKWWMFHCN